MRFPARLNLAASALCGTRLGSFRGILERLLHAGYRFLTHRDAAPLLRAGALPHRIALLRADVDAATPATAAVHDAARALGIGGSFYFRRSTLDLPLMRRIEADGGEASFHYETVAGYAADHRIADGTELRRRDFAPACRARLARDLAALRAAGLPCRTVASHGHAVNRALGIPNNILFEERAALAPLGLSLEAYDRDLIGALDAIACDAPADLNGGWLYGESPDQAAGRGASRILLQVHPHHWAAAPAARPRRALAALLRGPRTIPAEFRRV